MTPPDFVARALAPAGFFRRAKDVTVEGDARAWVLRGTSDRRWTYAGGDQVAQVVALLRPTDTHVAAAAPALAEALGRAREVLWRRDARTFTLPDGVALPDGRFEVSPLDDADAERIDVHWEHRDEVSLEYIRACLQRDPALGVRVNGELVGWELVHDDGAMGAAFVVPSWRRRGVMTSLQAALVAALRARGLPVFKHVALDNAAWLPAQERAGWRKVADACWLEVRG